MRSILLALAFALSVSLPALAQTTSAVAPEARAQTALKQARAAIWDETKAKPLESLSLTASRRLARGENQIEMTLDALLPDKFSQTVVINLGLGFGNELILIQTVNGPQAWSEVISPGASMTAAGKKRVSDGAGATQKMANDMAALAARMAAELSGMPDGFGATDDGSGATSADQINQPLAIQAGFTPLLLVWLLTAPPLLPLECAYAGQAKTQDGGQTADVLDLKGPHNFAARLFIDQRTRQVMMLTYKTGTSKVEVRWTASDYRNVNGLTLPHRLTRHTGGQLIEEIEIQKVKVNPSLKPDKFEKKEKRK
ncbi:MAG: hypothetical protein ACRD9Y_10615 [Blastocatellia bacterium]